MIDAIYALLKSLGFDEPLHSPITHMPIGLVVGALIFLAVALIFKKQQLVPSARHAAILAFVFVFPTILFGVFDWIHFYHGVMMPAIVIKMTLAGLTTLVLGAAIILGGEVKLHSSWLMILYALAFVFVMGLGFVGSGIIHGRSFTIPEIAQLFPGRAAATQAKGAAEAVDPVFKRGNQVFASNCQACHGNGANAIVPSLPLKTSTKLASLEKFTAYVRKPTMPNGAVGEMPEFSVDQLSDAQVADLYAYVTKAWK